MPNYNKHYKSFLFYVFLNLILLDFGNQLRNLSFKLIGYKNPIFSIYHMKNTGSAFSTFENYTFALALLGLVAVIFIGYYIYKNISFQKKLPLIILTLFSAGTLGNMIERLTKGYVVDYIRLNFINFAIFNAFDVMICTSIFIYIVYLLKTTGDNNGKA